MIQITPGAALSTLIGPAGLWTRRNRSFWRRADKNGPTFIGGSVVVQPDAKGGNLLTLADEFGTGKDAVGNDVIPQYPLESNNRWVIRKQRAKAPSIVRHIVDHYIAHVFRGEVTRTDLAGQAQVIFDNADGSGTPLTSMLRKAGRAALVEQASFLLVDTTLGKDAVTAADAAAQGARLVVRHVKADQVLDLEIDGSVVVEAVVQLVDQEGQSFLWQVTTKRTRHITLDESGLKVVSVGAWKPHNYKACPLIAVHDLPRFVPPVADSQKRLAVLDSLLQNELHASAFSQPVFTGVNPADTLELIRSNEYALAFPNDNAKAFMLGSDTKQADSIRAERDAELQNAYREAKVAPAVTEPGQPESGISRAYRFVDADVELASIAEGIERAERQVWEVLAGTGTVKAPTVTYPRTFIPTDDATELNKVLAVSASNLPKTLKRHFILEYAKGEGLSEEEVEQVKQEVDDQAEESDQNKNDKANAGT